LIRNLLIIWAVVSLGLSILLVQPLNAVKLGGVPLGFWIAQQGSIYVFVALIFVYAYQMDKLDRKYLRIMRLNQSKNQRQRTSISLEPLERRKLSECKA
jgi:putative solute:sodium symporter small subunit